MFAIGAIQQSEGRNPICGAVLVLAFFCIVGFIKAVPEMVSLFESPLYINPHAQCFEPVFYGTPSQRRYISIMKSREGRLDRVASQEDFNMGRGMGSAFFIFGAGLAFLVIIFYNIIFNRRFFD